MLPETDYNKEAEKLWASLGETRSFYNNLDPIHKSKDGGFIFVGSDTAARDLRTLSTRGITGVVNCTTNLQCYHLGQLGSVQPDYFKFDIAGWRRHTDSQDLKQFLSPVFEFMDVRLNRGESVLVHCLAGAHRAGTTGVMSLMHYEGLDSSEAIKEAKKRRPIIEPIGDFKTLLASCDQIPRESGQRRFRL